MSKKKRNRNWKIKKREILFWKMVKLKIIDNRKNKKGKLILKNYLNRIN